jgi:hypothetical protein
VARAVVLRAIIATHISLMKTLPLLALFIAFALPALADTITGEAQCAKCALKTTEKCQLAIIVTGADGKKETILADVNDPVAKAFHKQICQDNKKVTAEGTITVKDGKKTIALTKVEEAK